MSESFIFILITEFLILFNTLLSSDLFKSDLAKIGPAVKLLAIPICHIST